MSDVTFLPWVSSKSDIYASYKELFDKFQKLQALKPVASEAKADEKRKTDTLAKVGEYTPDSIIQGISRMKISIGKVLDELSQQLSMESEKLQDLREAHIGVQRQFNEEHDKAMVAKSLEALIQDFEEKRAEMTKEFSVMSADLEAQIEERRGSWLLEKTAYEKAQKELVEEDKKKRKREEEEYLYERTSARRKEEDLWKARFAELSQEYKLKRQQLEEKLLVEDHQIQADRKELEQLRIHGKKLESEIETVKATTIAVVEKDLKERHGYGLQLLEQKATAAADLAIVKIAGLEAHIIRQDRHIDELSAKLDLANSKVQDIANKAIEGASSANAFSAVNRIAMEQAKSRRDDVHPS
jgi:hypothetical protein